MRPVLAALALAVLPAALHAAVAVDLPRCAASVEEAARGILLPASSAASGAYRVQDLFIDPVLRKAWVRVADCRDSHKPLALVPLSATVAGTATASTGTALAALTSPAPTPVAVPAPLPRPAIIAPGDPVEILIRSTSVHMTLHGRATTAAAAGDLLDVELAPATSTADTPAPPRHLRGIATAAHHVEVQP